MARVENPLPPPIFCHHCGSRVEIKHHEEVYGKVCSEWPWVYRCADEMPGVECDAMVGMHPFTNIPLGTLATKPLREARQRAKALFEPLWINEHDRIQSRARAYGWLAEQLGIPQEECHFGWFDLAQCARVIEILTARKAA